MSSRSLQSFMALLCMLTVSYGWSSQVSLSGVDAAGSPTPHLAIALTPVTGTQLEDHASEGEIVQIDRSFVPLVSIVRSGTSVHFPNRDSVRHHVYSFSPPKIFELKLYVGTPEKPVVFDTPGLVVLGCNIHDQMIGYVLVRDTPWIAVTGEDGVAKIQGVPDGDYQLEWWHPDFIAHGGQSRTRTITVRGATEIKLELDAGPHS